jgi:hypothetical protein
VIDFDRLLGLALGELSGGELDEVEQHVIACGECAQRLMLLMTLQEAVVALVRAGRIAMPVTRELADVLCSAGSITRTYVLEDRQSVACTVDAHDVYAMVELRANLERVTRLDLIIGTPAGSDRIEDVPFDVADGAVRLLSPGDQLRSLPTAEIHLQLWGERAGVAGEIGAFVLKHTAYHPS